MTSTFTAVIKIKITHNKGTHIDENSVKGLVGNMIFVGRDAPTDHLCEVGDKTEDFPEAVKITLHSLEEGGETFDISDIEDYIEK